MLVNDRSGDGEKEGEKERKDSRFGVGDDGLSVKSMKKDFESGDEAKGSIGRR